MFPLVFILSEFHHKLQKTSKEGSEITAPLNFRKIATPKQQENQITPLLLGTSLGKTSNLIRTQPLQSGTNMGPETVPTWIQILVKE